MESKGTGNGPTTLESKSRGNGRAATLDFKGRRAGRTDGFIKKTTTLVGTYKRKATQDRAKLDKMHAFVDQGPDRGTKRLWSLAKRLHPDIAKNEIRLLGVDDLDEEISIPLRPLLRALYQLHRMRIEKRMRIQKRMQIRGRIVPVRMPVRAMPTILMHWST